jgi:hypothetical protein
MKSFKEFINEAVNLGPYTGDPVQAATAWDQSEEEIHNLEDIALWMKTDLQKILEEIMSMSLLNDEIANIGLTANNALKLLNQIKNVKQINPNQLASIITKIREYSLYISSHLYRYINFTNSQFIEDYRSVWQKLNNVLRTHKLGGTANLLKMANFSPEITNKLVFILRRLAMRQMPGLNPNDLNRANYYLTFKNQAIDNLTNLPSATIREYVVKQLILHLTKSIDWTSRDFGAKFMQKDMKMLKKLSENKYAREVMSPKLLQTLDEIISHIIKTFPLL